MATLPLPCAVSIRRRRRPGRLLRQVVPDAARERPVRVPARELLGVGEGRDGRAVGIAFQRDRGHIDRRRDGEPLLQFVVLRLALGQAQAPAVVVDHDGDVVRIVEGAALRSKVASSNFHFGDAVCQMSFANSRRYLS